MRTLIILTSLSLLAGCQSLKQSTIFADPEIVYQNQSGIGVRYVNAGVFSGDNENIAMDIISMHCNNSYKITNREKSGKTVLLDAECN